VRSFFRTSLFRIRPFGGVAFFLVVFGSFSDWFSVSTTLSGLNFPAPPLCTPLLDDRNSCFCFSWFFPLLVFPLQAGSFREFPFTCFGPLMQSSTANQVPAPQILPDLGLIPSHPATLFCRFSQSVAVPKLLHITLSTSACCYFFMVVLDPQRAARGTLSPPSWTIDED